MMMSVPELSHRAVARPAEHVLTPREIVLPKSFFIILWDRPKNIFSCMDKSLDTKHVRALEIAIEDRQMRCGPVALVYSNIGRFPYSLHLAYELLGGHAEIRGRMYFCIPRANRGALALSQSFRSSRLHVAGCSSLVPNRAREAFARVRESASGSDVSKRGAEPPVSCSVSQPLQGFEPPLSARICLSHQWGDPR